jgi:hypothetical protein
LMAAQAGLAAGGLRGIGRKRENCGQQGPGKDEGRSLRQKGPSFRALRYRSRTAILKASAGVGSW